MNEHDRELLTDWERELLYGNPWEPKLPPLPPLPPIPPWQPPAPPKSKATNKREKLIEELAVYAEHPDREYAQSQAEDALMEYIEDALSFGRQIADAYREASSYYNKHNVRKEA